MRKVMCSVGSSTWTVARATGLLRVGQRVADVDLLQPDDRADVADVDLVDLAPAQAVEAEQLRDLLVLRLAVAVDGDDVLAGLRSVPAKTRPMPIRPT